MEAGVYGSVEIAGVRSIKIPAPDRPPGLDPERLQVMIEWCSFTLPLLSVRPFAIDPFLYLVSKRLLMVVCAVCVCVCVCV